jgi:carotenoid 1,2-hydratase
MNIISNYSQDTKTEKKISGSYEWWYFDAQSVDGYKLVVIFYEGNPFSRRYIQALSSGTSALADEYPAISISIYKSDQPIYYSFREVDEQNAKFSKSLPKGRVENNHFEGRNHQTRLEYTLKINQTLSNGDSIKGNLLFSADFHSRPMFSGAEKQGPHEWNLVMPSGHVRGSITISGYHEEDIEFKGLGYHDHNVGFEPMKESFKEWYWGRYHLENSTFIYYLMNKKGIWEKKAWLIGKRGEVKVCDNVELSNYGLSLFGLKTARVIQAQAGENKIYVQLDETLDSGPFYQRFGGRLIMNSDERVEESRGISEYIKPARIYDRVYWPLVNMRIAYPGKQHWVQRSPILYRWTW